MIFQAADNLLCPFHIHVREEQLAKRLAFHNRSVEQLQETVHTDFLIVSVRIYCPELLCRLNKPPLVKRGLFQRKLQDSFHMFRLERMKHLFNIRSADKLRQTQIEPVRIRLDTDSRTVTGGKQNRKHSA